MELLSRTARHLADTLQPEDEQRPGRPLQIFTPWSNWTWFVTEGEPDNEDFRFFG